MKLIVGLGNPGNDYNFTRHNFGFLALDFFFKLNKLEWEKTEKFHCIWKKVDNQIFIKPQTFYNAVGPSIHDFISYYKIPLENLFVICDDFNLPFGETRLRKKGSAGGNNGLKSIIATLKTEDFARLRLGTGNNELRKILSDTDFVLGKFTAEEKTHLPDILKKVNEYLN